MNIIDCKEIPVILQSIPILHYLNEFEATLDNKYSCFSQTFTNINKLYIRLKNIQEKKIKTTSDKSAIKL